MTAVNERPTCPAELLNPTTDLESSGELRRAVEALIADYDANGGLEFLGLTVADDLRAILASAR